MTQTFNLPAIGDAMVEGEIVEWFIAVGDTVDLDQPVCSIETDKSVVELTTPYRGTVLMLGGAPGDVIEVGAPLFTVGEADEVGAATGAPAPEAAAPPEAEAPAVAPQNAATVVLSPVVRKLADDTGVDLTALVGTGHGGRITRTDVENAVAAPIVAATPVPLARGPVRAMPMVRKAAREASIDLRSVGGTGPDGAVLLTDLNGGAPTLTTGGERRERLSAMRRAIARHLTESVQTIPQFTSMVDVDATALLATRSALRERVDGPVPIDAVVLALLIPVLRDHPVINARLDIDTDEIVYADRYDIGVAVDTPDGLIVPVVKRADQRSLADLSAEIIRLATSARERTIQPQELSGATCTLNNVGAVGIETGTPILPMGTSAIIAIGSTRPIVQLRNGNAVEVPTMTISTTFDHRIVDGGDAGRFLTQLRSHLEVPALGLL